jgi:hypothetical protein
MLLAFKQAAWEQGLPAVSLALGVFDLSRILGKFTVPDTTKYY